ncbi:hypothetical protein ACFW1A_08530 [Kitasatospora sp. NPDC058965]|uniref:hypothetical protein n=1 Tax=Kitasatospora sp. NPDC058965 TaxID=3346682 RepID=UPI00368CD6F2
MTTARRRDCPPDRRRTNGPTTGPWELRREQGGALNSHRSGSVGGRPWGPLKGTSAEANAIAELLRAWLRSAGLTLDGLLAALTPDHFTDHKVPSRSTVSDWLAGRTPRWDFVEAVADICSPDSETAAHRSEQARPLWDRLRSAPTPVPGTAAVAAGTDALVLAQQQTIDVQDRLIHAQQALAASRQAEANAGQLVILLLQMIGRLNLRIGELSRRVEQLRDHPAPLGDEEQEVRRRLGQAEAHRQRAVREKERAEAKQREMLHTIDRAHREIGRLRAEAHGLASDGGPADAEADVLALQASDESDTAFLDDIAVALDKAARVNEAVDQLAQDARSALVHLDGAPATDLARTRPDPTPDNPDKPTIGALLTDNHVIGSLLALYRVFPEWRATRRALRASREIPSSAAECRQIAQVLEAAHRHAELGAFLHRAGQELTVAELCGLASSVAWDWSGLSYKLLLQGSTTRPAHELVELVSHLSDHDLPVSFLTEDSAFRKRPREDVVEISAQLRASGHDQPSLGILSYMVRSWPAPEGLAVADQLTAEGYEGQARVVLEVIGTRRPIPEAAELVTTLVARHRPAQASAVLSGAGTRKDSEILELLSRLLAADHDGQAQEVLASALTDRSVKHAAELLRNLASVDPQGRTRPALLALPEARARLIRTRFLRAPDGADPTGTTRS